MDFILDFLSNSPEVTAVAVLILASSWIAYLFWFRSAVREVTKGLHKLTSDVGQDVDGWQGCNERVIQSIKKHPRLAASWLETQERVTAVPVGEKTKHVIFGLPRDVWNVQTLLSMFVKFIQDSLRYFLGVDFEVSEKFMSRIMERSLQNSSVCMKAPLLQFSLLFMLRSSG